MGDGSPARPVKDLFRFCKVALCMVRAMISKLSAPTPKGAQGFPTMPAASTRLRVIGMCEAAADRWYQRFLEVVVYSSVWLAGALASLALFAAHVLQLPYDPSPALLIFFSTLFIYNIDHVADARVEGIPDERARDYFQHWGVGLLVIGSALATGLMVSWAPSAAQNVFVVYVTIGLVYGLPVIPVPRTGGLRWHRLKDIPGVKAWVVAGTIAFASVGLPLAWAGRPLDFDAWSVGVFTFVLIASGAHMCDVRDIDSDMQAGVRTLPIQAGVKRTKQALILMNLVLLPMMYGGWLVGAESHPEMLVVAAVVVLFILFIRVDSSKEAYNIVLDGTFYLPALVGLLHETLR